MCREGTIRNFFGFFFFSCDKVDLFVDFIKGSLCHHGLRLLDRRMAAISNYWTNLDGSSTQPPSEPEFEYVGLSSPDRRILGLEPMPTPVPLVNSIKRNVPSKRLEPSGQSTTTPVFQFKRRKTISPNSKENEAIEKRNSLSWGDDDDQFLAELDIESLITDEKERSLSPVLNYSRNRTSANTEEILPKEKFVFCTSRLNRDQLEKMNELCKICEGTWSREYTDDVTHLVFVLENDRVPQTMKYLYAIAGKKWVIHFSWIEECLKQNRMVPPEDYEPSNLNIPIRDHGPRKSRLTSDPLFTGLKFHCAINYKQSGASKRQWEKLLVSLGAEIETNVNFCYAETIVLSAVPNNHPTITHDNHLFKIRKILTVAFDWIVECVVSYRVISLFQKGPTTYLITHLYPHELTDYSMSMPDLFVPDLIQD